MCQPQNLRGWYITCPQSPQRLLGSPFYQCLERNWPLLRVRKRVSRRILQPHHPWGKHALGLCWVKSSALIRVNHFRLQFPFAVPIYLPRQPCTSQLSSLSGCEVQSVSKTLQRWGACTRSREQERWKPRQAGPWLAAGCCVGARIAERLDSVILKVLSSLNNDSMILKWECFQKGHRLHHSFLTELCSCYLSQSLSCHSSLIVSGTTRTFVKTGWHLKIALNLRERNLKENKSPWLQFRVRKVFPLWGNLTWVTFADRTPEAALSCTEPAKGKQGRLSNKRRYFNVQGCTAQLLQVRHPCGAQGLSLRGSVICSRGSWSPHAAAALAVKAKTPKPPPHSQAPLPTHPNTPAKPQLRAVIRQCAEASVRVPSAKPNATQCKAFTN